MASGEPLEGEAGGGLAASSEEGGDSTERQSVPSEIGEVSFPVSVRGYDRGAVDAYVNRVQAFVAELELTRSPEAAVTHALERVGEQTKGILERAGETAEQITGAARQAADEGIARATGEAEDIVATAKAEEAELLARSKAEANATVAQARNDAAEHSQRAREEIAALRKEAEARMRELQADTETIRQERSQLLNDIRAFVLRVEEVASSADARFPPPDAAAPAEEAMLPSEAAGEADATEATETDKPTADIGTGRHSPR
jgi:DivIVA domain-containing protein